MVTSTALAYFVEKATERQEKNYSDALQRKSKLEACSYPVEEALNAKKTYPKLHVDTTDGVATLIERLPSGGAVTEPVRLPRTYNAEDIQRYWQARPLSVARRVGQIITEITPLGLAYFRDFKLHDMISQMDDSRNDELLQHAHAANLRDVLTRLGPAFVKMGQQLSIRPDLVPPPVLAELQKLCDSVEPVPDSVAMEVLREELGLETEEEIYEIFSDLHRVAAASLGQVYKAEVKETGQAVAIKIQRPDMLRRLSLDLFLLQTYGRIMDSICSVLTEQIPYHANFMDCFAQGSYMELDYENEAANQMRFKSEFERRKCQVTVPSVHFEYTSVRVITSDWIDGTKLVDAPRDQIRRLIPVGVELFLTQLLDIGAFHSDPHPANLYVTTSGQLCLLDFGLCAEIDEQSRHAMTSAIVNLLSGDFDSLISKDAKELGFLPHELDVTELKPILTKILTEGLLEAGSNLHTRKRKLMDISNELNEIFFRYPFEVPPFFALITRGLGLLEGIALSGDSEFDIFQAAGPYARKRAIELFGAQFLKRKLQRRGTAQKSAV